jgi:small subunit ribosomal protein S13
MARIEGVDLPRSKRIEVGLTYIFGIGQTRAKEIIAETNVSNEYQAFS